MKAGQYTDKMIWLKFNELTNEFDEHKEVWAYVEELSADEIIAYGRKAHVVDCLVHVRELHDIQSEDRLKDKSTNDTYDIHGVRNADHEVICDCTRYTGTTP